MADAPPDVATLQAAVDAAQAAATGQGDTVRALKAALKDGSAQKAGGRVVWG